MEGGEASFVRCVCVVDGCIDPDCLGSEEFEEASREKGGGRILAAKVKRGFAYAVFGIAPFCVLQD